MNDTGHVTATDTGTGGTRSARVLRFSSNASPNGTTGRTRKPVPPVPPLRSSWIDGILYRRVNGQGYLAILTHDERTGKPVALFYGPSETCPFGVPSWVPGLVKAGTGRRSPGLAFNRLVKSQRYGYRRVEGEEKVRELKEMMK